MSSNELRVLDDARHAYRAMLDADALPQARLELIRATNKRYLTHQADSRRFGGKA